MKTITNYIKMLVVLCIFAGAKTGTAQTCTPTFVYSTGAGGFAIFNASAPGYSSVTPSGTFTWYYGSGASTSTGAFGSFYYQTNGIYTVTLMYVNANLTCSASVSQTIAITTATTNACGMNISFTQSQGINGNVTFNNTTTGAAGSVTYLWNYGDGYSSTATSPMHTYATNGTYNVWLVANNNSTPNCIDSIMSTVVVNSWCNMNAGFTYAQNANNFSFSNTTTGSSPIFYSWAFGDGSSSGASNPSHSYASTGTYTVSLIAVGGNSLAPCGDTITQVVNVSTVCVANAGFSLSPTGTPQVWNATPTAPANIVGATWYWGDGYTSNTLYTSHTYTTAGTYSICLTVSVSCGSTATSCYTYSIYRSSQDMSMIQVNVVSPTTPTGIKTEGEDIFRSIYPNPNNGTFNLDLKGLSNGNVNISVYNLVGKLVYQSDNTSTNGSLVKDIQLDTVSNGVYFIKVNSDNKLFTKKVIVNKQ